MKIDFENDKVFFLGQCLPLSVTTSGHYILPLTKQTLMLCSADARVNMILTAESSNKSKKDIAIKLHRQFAHAPAEKIIKLLKSAKDPWNSDTELFDCMEKVSITCDTCNRYRTAPARPAVGLPMATKFQETVAMDLKFYDSKIILHLIDHATRLSSAKLIPNKQPETVVKAILKSWVSIYGSSEQFLTDNGREFCE